MIMKIFKVVKKRRKNDPNYTWHEELTLLIVAANFSNAEDKAKNFETDYPEISHMQEVGETTQKDDVYKLKDRL